MSGPRIDHTLCIDCSFYHFTDFGRLNRTLDDMHVKDTHVDINNLSLGVCYRTGGVVGSYDVSCKSFKGINMDHL